MAIFGAVLAAACDGSGTPEGALGDGEGQSQDAGVVVVGRDGASAGEDSSSLREASSPGADGSVPHPSPDGSPPASDAATRGDSTAPSGSLLHVLFVGDSLTHGRYTPVRPYNSGGKQELTGSNLVVDENYGQTGSRAELEPGPWGGVAGIFAELAAESHLAYDVHIEAISATSLKTHASVASGVIYQSKWDVVILQEKSTLPLTGSLSGTTKSNPSEFCASVEALEQGVHGVAPAARIYLYETWARADTAQTLSGSGMS